MKILTLGNCHAQNLGLILEISCVDISCQFLHIDSLTDDTPSMFGNYDLVIIQEHPRLNLFFKLKGEDGFLFIPNISFIGYHPDIMYLKNTNNDYLSKFPQSNIITNSFFSGISKTECSKLFTKEFIKHLNYDEVFEVSKQNLISHINNSGMDGPFLFDKWHMNSPFVLVPTHPELFVLKDLALHVCSKANIKMTTTDIYSVYNNPMKRQEIFPAYNGKKNKLHSRSQFYKIRDKTYSLDEFISYSYSLLEVEFPNESPTSHNSNNKIDIKKYERFKNAYNKYTEKSNGITKLNPYKGRPNTSMWRRAVAGTDPHALAPFTKTNPIIGKFTKVATAGSCFAQHIARTLATNGLNYYVAEPAPEGLTPEKAKERSYHLFSARYGNIYTAKQLVQLFKRAYGQFSPDENAWTARSGQHIDPFRPNIGEEFETVEKLLEQRDIHLAAVRKMFEDLDVFIFTLGLTESWVNSYDGAAYPVAPGVISQHDDYSNYVFKNFSHEEIREDMIEFFGLLRSVNRQAEILLTVSPVPLIATYENEHVLSANTYSKSVLRAVAGELTKAFSFVSYFPSYEIINGSHSKGIYYEDDLRSIKPEGVAHVMGVFMDYMVADNRLTTKPIQKNEDIWDSSLILDIEKNSEIVCDEELIDLEEKL